MMLSWEFLNWKQALEGQLLQQKDKKRRKKGKNKIKLPKSVKIKVTFSSKILISVHVGAKMS